MRFCAPVLFIVSLFVSGCSVSNQQRIPEGSERVVERYENGQKKSEGHILGDGVDNSVVIVERETSEPNTLSYGYTVTAPRKVGAWIYWHENGQKMMEGTYENGMMEGRWTVWHKNGQKDREGTYKNGEGNGLWTYWYENGQKRGEGKFKSNMRDGYWTTWDENGQKLSEGTYKNGSASQAFTGQALDDRLELNSVKAWICLFCQGTEDGDAASFGDGFATKADDSECAPEFGCVLAVVTADGKEFQMGCPKCLEQQR
jgi:antitoxin component YwqK of YwqJK toxin-antitoxin module